MRGAQRALAGIAVASLLVLAACGSAAPGQSSGAQANHHPSATTKTSKATSSGAASKSGASGAGAKASAATSTTTSANVKCVAGKAGTKELVQAPQEPAAGVATPAAPCWSQIAPTPLYQTVLGKLPSGASAVFKTAWSGQDLYIWADVQHWPMYCSKGAQWYNCDALEIYVGPNDQKAQYGPDDHQLGILASTGAFETGTNGAGVTGVKTASVVTKNKGYMAQMALPLSDIGVKAAAGGLVGFSMAADIPAQADANQGNGTVAQMMWAGDANNWQSAAHWGGILLQ